MKTKLFLLAMLMFAGTMLSGCELLGGGENSGKDDDDEPTGSSNVSMGGGDEINFDIATMSITDWGETDIMGLYVTGFNFVLESSDNPGVEMNVRFMAFHDTPSFTPGTYTFPSTGAGTASGDFDYNMRGEIISGSVTISVSGNIYTVTANDVTARIDDSYTETVNFSYTGEVRADDNSTSVSVPKGWFLPDFPGQSTIVEKISGLSFPYMNLDISYNGYTDEEGSHHYYNLRLTSEKEGVLLEMSLEVFTGSRDFRPGTYTVPEDYINTAGNFGGWILLQGDDVYKRTDTVEGEIVISESDGIYTVQFNNVVGIGSFGSDARTEIDGTYTGICSNFYDGMSE